MSRLLLVLCLSVVSATKAKVCDIHPKMNSTSVTRNGTDCTTIKLTSCNATEKITELRLSHNKIENITEDMFDCLKNLKKLHLDGNLIATINQGAFSSLGNLEHLNLENNRISSISPGVFKGLHLLKKLYLGKNAITEIKKNSFLELKSLETLDLDHNGLRRIAPGAFDELITLLGLKLHDNDLREMPVFKKTSPITNLEMSSNPIRKLDVETLGKLYNLNDLYLQNTEILQLQNRVFINNTQLKILSLKGSKLLKNIGPKAFEGPQLIQLDLQATDIDFLPGDGLESLKGLVIKDAKKLWEIPIVSFKSLVRAKVEYPFHCCLIESNYDALDEIATQQSLLSPPPTANYCNTTENRTTTTARPTTTDPFQIGPKRNKSNAITLAPDTCYNENKPRNTKPPKGSRSREPLVCVPENDAFNPCGDLLGSDALRVCSWIVLVFALLGNSFKLFVLLLSKRKISITRILMCNLAFANLCMGVFLLMIVCADMYSLGRYQNFAVRWQYRTGCKIAGFVSIFSTELAVFVLTIITVERFFTIVHPLKQNKHLKTKQVIALMGVGWFFSLTMAFLPLVGVSGYHQVAICLPFDVEDVFSKIYVTFLLATNGLAFLFVLFCYGRMYCSLGGSGPGASVTRVEFRVARRMAMLVITNFACWFPIALVSLIAIYGTTLIGVKTAQFFLVFVYPINSFTNPYLYAIGTKHFQLDALEILNRLGICKSAIEKVSNRLRDQLETLPYSSRGVTGSKVSLSSARSPGISPKSSFHSASRENSHKSQNGSVRSNSNFKRSVSSWDSPSCTPCNFLTIPLIHRRNYDLDKERETADSRFSLNMQNDETEQSRYSLKSSDSELDKICARRQSAKEIFLEGENCAQLNEALRKSRDSANVEELLPLKSATRDVNKNTEETNDDNPILKVPVVMVTTC